MRDVGGSSDEKVEGSTVHTSAASSLSGASSGSFDWRGQSVTHAEIQGGGGVGWLLPEMTDWVTVTLGLSVLFCTVTQQRSHSKLLREISGQPKTNIRLQKKGGDKTIERIRVNRVAL